MIIFSPGSKIIISLNLVRYFWYTTALYTYSLFLQVILVLLALLLLLLQSQLQILPLLPLLPQLLLLLILLLLPLRLLLLLQLQQILLERPRLVSDHFYLATIITCPNQNEAENNGPLKYMLCFQDNPMLLVLIWIVSSRRFKWVPTT